MNVVPIALIKHSSTGVDAPVYSCEFLISLSSGAQLTCSLTVELRSFVDDATAAERVWACLVREVERDYPNLTNVKLSEHPSPLVIHRSAPLEYRRAVEPQWR